jgi:aminoglycoside phosphotransferase (APT) family kinase protein
MPDEAFVGLISRALRTTVHEISRERIGDSALAETERVRWHGPEGEGRLVFKRVAEGASLEVQLLPFLARRGLPVPRVWARGIPPRHASERRPWLLADDTDGATLCEQATEALARQAGEFVVALQRVTANDKPALVALGVPPLTASGIRDEALAATELLEAAAVSRLAALAAELDVARLEALGTSLVHGDFGCPSIIVGPTSLLVVEWSRAHLGCPLQDLAALVMSLRPLGARLADAAIAGFGGDAGLLQQAQFLHSLYVVRWFAFLARSGIISRAHAASAIGPSLTREASDRP